jgi:uncharacterized protein
MIVVSDTSALSALLQIQRIGLLSELYGEIFIPKAVNEELCVRHSPLPDFIQIRAVSDLVYCARLQAELDLGEAEAIVLAKEMRADELLIDENKGRRIAAREGVPVIGLLGVLLEAKLRGLVPSITEIIGMLEAEARFHLDARLKARIIAEAGEA